MRIRPRIAKTATGEIIQDKSVVAVVYAPKERVKPKVRLNAFSIVVKPKYAPNPVALIAIKEPTPIDADLKKLINEFALSSSNPVNFFISFVSDVFNSVIIEFKFFSKRSLSSAENLFNSD